jgi:hypothetical protein
MCSWGVLDQKWGGARIGSISKLSRARNSLGEKYLYVSEEQFVGPPRHHSGTQSRRLAKPFTASPPAQGRHPQRGFARTSKPWNARLWFSSISALPWQSDEALAKSSAKRINFSRHAGSLISRKAFIKRTPSLGSAALYSCRLLTSSSGLLCLVLRFIFTPLDLRP